MSKQDAYEEEGVVKDENYIINEEHGSDEYDPVKLGDLEKPVDPNEIQPLDHNLRESTKIVRETPGLFAEDESGFDQEGRPLPVADDEKEKDTSRQLSSLVAASHRVGRDEASKRASAEKASELHEKVTGQPLEINAKGEVETDTPVSQG